MAYDWIKEVAVSLAGGNGLTIANDHFDASGDYRLREAVYTWTGTGELAEFGYQYDAGGRITRWDQKVGAGDPRRIVPAYDMVSQLTGASSTNPVTNTPVGSEAFRYDRIGNRLGAQKGSDVTQATFNRVNQITSQAGGGQAVIRGLLDEPGTVTIGGKTVRTDAQNQFSLTVPVTTGTNQFSVVSSNINGNSTTNTATFTVAASGSTSFIYDLNGNTIDDGQRTYEWDGAGRVVAINYTGTNTRTEFAYDGMSRIVRINELAGGVSTSESRFVWDGMAIAERRAADGVTVQKRYFAAGFQYSGTSGPENYFYVKDHLGSIRALVDSGGVERGRWNYDLWGNRGLNQVLSGAVESDFGYTGHLEHSVSGLTIAPFRFYDSALGRWISRDPIGEDGGLNLYGYVANNPVDAVDPLGLDVRFNFSDGTRQIANTATEFMKIATSASKGSIDAIIVNGHGDSQNANFHPEDRNSPDGLSLVGDRVKIFDGISTEGDPTIGFLGSWLADKFDPEGQKLFAYNNCYVARGPENIAKATSKALPGIKIKGNEGSSVIFPNGASFLFPNTTPDVIYIDGILQRISRTGF